MATAMPTNARTFSLQSPADLYRKLHFEALALRNSPPAELDVRAYAVMNAVTTAWQMKDWAYSALDHAGQLDHLHQFAGKRIKGTSDFGTYLAGNSPWMNMCFQLATAAKHFEVGQKAGPEVITSVDFRVDPPAIARDLAGREEIMVTTHNNTISGPDLVLLLDDMWRRALIDLNLLDADVAD